MGTIPTKRRKLTGQAQDCPVTRKRSFWSLDAALFFVGAFNASRAYKCEHCKLWHLTTQKKTGKVNEA